MDWQTGQTDHLALELNCVVFRSYLVTTVVLYDLGLITSSLCSRGSSSSA